MKIENVKQWQCCNGLAVAVNPCKQWKPHPFNEKISYGAYDWKVFNQWASDPANQPVTDLEGIYNSEQVKIIDQYRHGHCDWTDCKPGDYQIPKVSYLFRKKLIAIPEVALCNTDISPEVIELNINDFAISIDDLERAFAYGYLANPENNCLDNKEMMRRWEICKKNYIQPMLVNKHIID